MIAQDVPKDERIDNTCHHQNIMAKVQKELESYNEDELFNGDLDEYLDLDILEHFSISML